MKQALIYSLKVWLTGVVLTLIGLGAIYCITMALRGYNVIVSVIAYVELVFIHLGLTCPLFLLFAVTVHFISNTLLAPTIQKVILSLAACALIVLLLVALRLIVGEPLIEWKNILPNHFPIVIVTLFSIWLYKLPEVRRRTNSVSI